MGGNRARGIGIPSLEEMKTGTSVYHDGPGIFALAMYTPSGTIPTRVSRGCLRALSFGADNVGTAEYAECTLDIPSDWDQSSDFTLDLWFYQASAESSGEEFVFTTQYTYINHKDTMSATYAHASGTLTLDSDGTTQYLCHHLGVTIPYRGAMGTAERGGAIGFHIYTPTSGTIGEACLLSARLGYYANEWGGTKSSEDFVAFKETAYRPAH